MVSTGPVTTVAAPVVGMIGVMTAPNTEPATEPVTPESEQATARAASAAMAARQVRHAAGRWLTSDRIPVLGQALALSIDRYQQVHLHWPTWADAVAGVDPALLAPLQQVPDGWPHQPALWRRGLRQHLMSELRRTRWITYTRTPRSLHPGEMGRGWLRATIPYRTDPFTADSAAGAPASSGASKQGLSAACRAPSAQRPDTPTRTPGHCAGAPNPPALRSDTGYERVDLRCCRRQLLCHHLQCRGSLKVADTYPHPLHLVLSSPQRFVHLGPQQRHHPRPLLVTGRNDPRRGILQLL